MRLRLLGLLIVLVAFFSHACLASTGYGLTTQLSFDQSKLKVQLQQLVKTAQANHLKADDLRIVVAKIESVHNRALECVRHSQAQLKELSSLIDAAKPDTDVEAVQGGADVKYLSDKKSEYTAQLSECRVIVYQSREALVKYKDQLQILSAKRLLERSTPIWAVFSSASLQNSLTNLKMSKVYDRSGIAAISMPELIVGVVLLLLGVGVGFAIRRLCSIWLESNSQYESITLYSFVLMLRQMVIWLICTAIIAVFFFVINNDETYNPSIELIGYALLGFFLCYSFSRFLFKPPQSRMNPARMSAKLGGKFHRRVLFLLSWNLLAYTIVVLSRDLQITPQLSEIARTFYVTVQSILTVWFCWLFCRLKFLREQHQSINLLIKVFLSLLLFIMLSAEWLGYHHLSVYVVIAVLATFLILGVAGISWKLVELAADVVDNSRYVVSQKIHRLFGVKIHRKLSEVVLIKYIVHATILWFAVLGLMKAWRVAGNIYDKVIFYFNEGFYIGGLHIIPFKLLVAFAAFPILVLLSRFISTAYARRQGFRQEAETQVAVATIILYIGSGLALLVTLLLLGVSFTGLAIVAGALSVGIGLGLQNIVNNFVSGLILLIEKPIRPGDRIVIDGTEGIVKKIRIRSTQVTTMAKEDVIFPNSDLITHPVTNYMFRDRMWRVTCQAGVAYGSDIDLVRKVMLEVAASNETVVQEGENAPMVLFREFGDSALIFELWCVIKDVNLKYVVASELNFDIDQAFRKHGITIAFPQRDLHIKEPIKSSPPSDT